MTTVRMSKLSEMPDFVPAGFRTPCRDVDPEWFFPLSDKYSGLGRQVCAECAVRQRCAEWAIDTGEPFGLWGGLDPDERKALRRKRMLMP